MKHSIPVLLIFCLSFFSCHSNNANTEIQDSTKIVGAGCDGCELMYQGMPENISTVDTCIAWFESGQRLHVKGKVQLPDSITPVPNVVLYYWQTDAQGYYSKSEKENTIHGHLRGWVKTDKDGRFDIFTIKPASYPNSNIPAHIHFSVKEPNVKNEYYIDDLVFDDDPLLTSAERNKMPFRGGSGILKPVLIDSILSAEYTMYLGLNIPDHPYQKK